MNNTRRKGNYLISLFILVILCVTIVLADNTSDETNLSELNYSDNLSLENISDTNLTLTIINKSTNYDEINLSEPELNYSNNLSLENVSNTDLALTPIVDNTTFVNNSVEEPKKIVKSEGNIEAYKPKLNSLTYNWLKNAGNDETNFIIVLKNSKDFSSVNVKKRFSNIQIVMAKKSSIEKLLEDDAVEHVEVDQEVDFFSEDIPWNVEKTKANLVWGNSTGNGVKVAVLDSGIANHSDLSIAGGVSVVGGDYGDIFGHGTEVAGVVAGVVNNAGLIGVSPGVGLYAVKITNSGSGSLSDAIEGLQWAINNNIDIVVMSFGFNEYSQIFKEKVQEAYNKDMILVGAAGNNGENNILFPAAYSDVIAVGATNNDNGLASFSNYGYDIELVAPGEDINTTSLENGYAVVSGTSFAVPHVAGVAALIKELNSSLTNNEIRGKIRNDALDLGEVNRDKYFGFGLVQANVTSINYTFNSDHYYYEAYTILFNGENHTNYTIQDLYTKGYGTIDDINFTEGNYLIKKFWDEETQENIYNVNESGKFELQSMAISFSESFTSEGSTTSDGYAWIEAGEGTFYIAPQKTGSENDGYCLDEDNDAVWEECVYDDAADLDDCKDYSGTLGGYGYTFYNVCTDTPAKCSQDVDLDNAYWQDSSFIKMQTARIEWYWDCDANPGASNYGGGTEHFYIFDRKKAVCTSSTQYEPRGRYDAAPATFIKYNTLSCPATKLCDYDQDEQETASETANINPCRQKSGEACNVTSECFTGLTCSGGTCQGSTTDLQIFDVIPIQVVSNVDIVKDKSGYVLVIVKNNGPNDATALVNVTFDGSQLPIVSGQDQSAFIGVNENITFNFSFKPDTAGTSKTLSANVTIVE